MNSRAQSPTSSIYSTASYSPQQGISLSHNSNKLEGSQKAQTSAKAAQSRHPPKIGRFQRRSRLATLSDVTSPARLPDDVSAHQALRRQIDMSLGWLPDTSWKRPAGRPRMKWLDHRAVGRAYTADSDDELESAVALETKLKSALNDCSRQRLRSMKMTLHKRANVDTRVTYKDLAQVFQENNIKIDEASLQQYLRPYENGLGVDYVKLWQRIETLQSDSDRGSAGGGHTQPTQSSVSRRLRTEINHQNKQQLSQQLINLTSLCQDNDTNNTETLDKTLVRIGHRRLHDGPKTVPHQTEIALSNIDRFL